MSRQPLTDRERDILAFERQWWKYAGTKDSAVREAFDLRTADYYRVLSGLLDHPDALASDPLLVRRLRRQRSQRQQRRSAARRGA